MKIIVKSNSPMTALTCFFCSTPSPQFLKELETGELTIYDNKAVLETHNYDMLTVEYPDNPVTDARDRTVNQVMSKVVEKFPNMHEGRVNELKDLLVTELSGYILIKGS